jgi:hypothetical protein
MVRSPTETVTSGADLVSVPRPDVPAIESSILQLRGKFSSEMANRPSIGH